MKGGAPFPARTPSPAGSIEAGPLLPARTPSPGEAVPRPSTAGATAYHYVSAVHQLLERRVGPDSRYRLLGRDGTPALLPLIFAPGMLLGGIAIGAVVPWQLATVVSLLREAAASISYGRSLLSAIGALVILLSLALALVPLAGIVLGLLHFVTGCMLALLRRMLPLPHAAGAAAGPRPAALLPR